MGLDMYLEKRVYVGAKWHDGNSGKTVEVADSNGKLISFPADKIGTVSLDVGYWRKAYQIHQWFVDNVPEGEDDCKDHWVPNEKLKELLNLCKKVKKTKDATPLPPTSGCFFGSAEVDKWYWADIDHTIEILSSLDEDGEYYYQSSW